jgi:carbamate kinase
MKYFQCLAVFAIIGMILGLQTVVNEPKVASAQTASANTPKTITFDTFIIHLDKDGVMTKFQTSRQSINGTNDQLVAKFPAVLKSFYNASRTDRHAVFVNYERTAQGAISALQNVTEQAYINEFKNSLADANPSTHRCWIIVEPVFQEPGAGTGNIHVYKCW